MFPDAKLAIGPDIENGFYYDFDLPRTLIPEDLTILEKKMKQIVKQAQRFVQKSVPIDEAISLLGNAGQSYKVEMAEDLKKQGEKEISFYENFMPGGETKMFVDMCRGPHVDHTGQVGAFKLTTIAGAYWRGDEKNKMLQRIYAVSFATQVELDTNMKMLEEAKKRDHRKLGQELELFTFDDEVGPGLPLWLPRGAYLRNRIMEFAFNTYLKNGYDPVVSPHIANAKLWGHSGHLDFYSENMYGPMMIDEEEYRIKPMNCPFHVKMYKSKMHSYRDLPCRWTEMGTVYRYERSGVLHGLTRVRGFTQDDAHIICRPDQLKNEIAKALELTLLILNKFGFKEFEMNVSVRDPENKTKFIGEDDRWEQAEQVLKEVLNESGFKDYVYDIGGAVFYGPKIDVKVADSIGRKWQLSTIQFDFNLPAKFGMNYIGEDGKEHTPFMIHRALLGSLERFIGVFIEHTAGAFPVWLTYYPVAIIPVASAHERYAETVKEELWKHGVRSEIYAATDTLGKRIRETELKKIPYMLVIGEKEVAEGTVAVRDYATKKQEVMKKEEFVKKVTMESEADYDPR